MLRRTPVVAALAALAATPLAAQSASAAAPAPCPNASAIAGTIPLPAAATAVLCVVNRERTRRGIPALTRSTALTRAAAAHSSDMVRRRYFSHLTLSGRTPEARVRAAGYAGPSSGIQESLALGTAERSTPAALVATMMGNAAHRRILLDRRLRAVGVGIALGFPTAKVAEPSATLTVDLGTTTSKRS